MNKLSKLILGIGLLALIGCETSPPLISDDNENEPSISPYRSDVSFFYLKNNDNGDTGILLVFNTSTQMLYVAVWYNKDPFMKHIESGHDLKKDLKAVFKPANYPEDLDYDRWITIKNNKEFVWVRERQKINAPILGNYVHESDVNNALKKLIPEYLGKGSEFRWKKDNYGKKISGNYFLTKKEITELKNKRQ